ncbi:MAG: hypothetical protein NC320_00900 [Clostridium sp.]|nr:hypothetical protein [Clostridium sp.]
MKKSGEVYYPRLESEIIGRGIQKKDIYGLLEIDRSSLTNKLNGNSSFTIEQALLIWKKWFSDIPIDKLFKSSRK